MTTAPPPEGQLARAALLYALLVVATAVGLLARDLPLWITLLALGCIALRLRIFTGHWPFPSPWQKALLVVGACTGIGLQYRTGLTLEVYIALLLTGLPLKALEVYHTRSAQRLLYVAVLALMAYLLFASGFIATLLALGQMALIVAALVAVNADPQRLAAQPLAPLRTAGVTLSLAAPLLVFLFVVMPRLPPLWAMPLPQRQAQIGMGEDMSPGDFSRPARSAELAFRAGFLTAIPPAAELYWRGTVLDEFDGRRWKNQCDCNYRWRATDAEPRPQEPAAYNIVLEPHGHRWIFTLDQAQLADAQISGNGENLFRYRHDLNDRITYDVWQRREATPMPPLSAAEQQRYTQLPERGNARARELAEQWRRTASSDAAIIQQALTLYHQSFVYTLEPPLLGADSIDDFLFRTQRGFCEHFAGSFVFLMRAAGLPARVVMGYQGGQRNLKERYVSVRQYDAHAWAEVWQSERGWVRIDPTGAVAPERVEQGFAELFPDSPAFATLLGLPSRRPGSLLGLLSIKLDYLDYLVGRWVLGYDADRQQALLQRLGLASPEGLLMAFGGGLALILSGFLGYLYWRDHHARPEPPLTIRYRRLCARYARLGWERQPSETPGQFAARLAQAQAPESQRFLQLSRLYAAWCYRPTAQSRYARQLYPALQALGWRLLFRPSRRPS